MREAIAWRRNISFVIVAKYLLLAAGAIFCTLGIVHAIFTAFGLLQPRDADVITRMRSTTLRLSRRTNTWKAWLGFNLSHALGLVIFGMVCITTMARPWLLAVVAAFYFVLAARFWFNAPAITIGIAAVCLVIAAAL
jgi:hypothetical protein